jgi:hypothetical protein
VFMVDAGEPPFQGSDGQFPGERSQKFHDLREARRRRPSVFRTIFPADVRAANTAPDATTATRHRRARKSRLAAGFGGLTAVSAVAFVTAVDFWCYRPGVRIDRLSGVYANQTL